MSMNGPSQITRSERLHTCQDIAGRLHHVYGARILAIGVYGSVARGTDGPFSDIEMFCVLKESDEDVDFSHEWSAGAKNHDDYIKGLEKLGTKPEKTIVFRYKQVTDEEGKKTLELIDKSEHIGNIDPSNQQNGGITTFAGNKSDLTMWVDVLPGEDVIHGLEWITLDYYFEWSDTEYINGSDDGWAVNWDTEEAYADATGADGDIEIEREAIGGMGMTTDDDNELGNAYVILTPRSGYDKDSADGEITFEYAHTWGIDAPPISFSVSGGVVSIGSEIDLEENAWRKAGRDTY